MTEIIPEKKKDVAFKRGRIIEREDVERLLDLGKCYVYVIEGGEKEVHEEEAARRIAEAAMDEHMALTPPKEGRINLASTVDGLVSVNTKKLYALNSVEHVAFTTVPDRYPVRAGEMVAATRILPLYIDEPTLEKAERLGKQGVIKILPFQVDERRACGDGKRSF